MAKRRDDDLLANFLPVNRKFFNHPFWDEERTFSKSEAWLDLIRSARFEESEARALMGGRLVKWSRGQLPASLRFLADRWKWSKNKVDDFLRLLEREKMISRAINEGQTIITLSNYEIYNQKGRQKGQLKGRQNARQAYIPENEGDDEKDSKEDGQRTDGGRAEDKTNNMNIGNKEEDDLTGAGGPAYTPDEKEMFSRFQDWISKNAGNVAKMKEPFSIGEYLKLRKKISKEQVQDILLKMHNWKPLLQKNNSAYLTLMNWSKKEYNLPESAKADTAINSINEKLKAAGRKILPATDSVINVFGRIPPQAKDLEEAVLGAILLEKAAIDAVTEILTPDCFYLDKNQRIYRAIQGLAQRSQPIDILTVVEELRMRQELDTVGGPYYVTQLTNSVVSSANIEAHGRIILQKFIQRELIRIGGDMVRDGFEESTDVFELLDSTETQILGISLGHLKKDFNRVDSGLIKVLNRLEKLRQKDQFITGVPSGFRELDQCTHGWQNTDLIILAARPAIGKTAFALNLAFNAAMNPVKPTPVGFFSLEMSEAQLIQRMLSAESEIHLERIMSGRLDDAAMKQLYNRGVQMLAKAPLFIDDTAGLNMLELRAKARRMKNKFGIGLIIIDYLQLMTGDTNKSENREREISKISRELKKLAKDLEVPIIALSQLSRKVEERGRGQKVPILSDLRESGAIEQDADLVMFLYRPPDEEIKEDLELQNRGMVKIAKHRNGRLDEIVLKFYGEIQKWMDLASADRYEGRPGAGWKPVPAGTVIHYSEPYKSDSDIEDLPF